MNNKDFLSQAERYRQEMMSIYNKSTVKNESSTVSDISTQPIQEVITEEIPQDIVEKDEVQSDFDVIENNIESEEVKNDVENFEIDEKTEDLSSIVEKYPDPIEIMDVFAEKVETFNDEEYYLKNGYNQTGTIIVQTRTGDSAIPVENVSVIISAMIDGNLVFKESAVTNKSGMTREFQLPAPSADLSFEEDPNRKPYAVYDISVYEKGYFKARSIDVPVFPNITSIQNINMIPLPAYIEDSAEIITYYNQEPEF